MGNVLNLKEHLDLLPQYVELRNGYCDLLLTHTVKISESFQWIKNTTAVIKVIEEENCILGVLLLYIERDGEVAFFARQQNKGIGTRLLKIADDEARQLGLPSIWAWVREDNFVAAKAFEKCGYTASGLEKRDYKGEPIMGIKYTKLISEKNN